jgi:hypothetical protein
MDSLSTSSLSNESIQFSTALKVFPTKGNLVYEYNPFRNYRLNEDKVYYDNRLWSYEEFREEFKDDTYTTVEGIINNSSKIDKEKSAPVIY